MVDRAYPDTAAEFQQLKAAGVEAFALYVGGVNNGGRRDWHPDGAAKVRGEFQFVLPIYVGENQCDGCKTPLTLTKAQGQADGADAVACAKTFGFPSGPLCLDVEYDTYYYHTPESLAYMEAWATAVQNAGYRPVHYGTKQTAIDYLPPAGQQVGLWIANWDRRGDLTQFPHPERFAGIGWQYDSNFMGFDLSNVDGKWWGDALPEPAPQPRPTQDFDLSASDDPWHSPHGDFDILNRFIDDINHGGGFMPVGYCVTGAFGEGEVVVQYFERARMELHKDGSVTRGLLGLEVLAGRHPDLLPMK